jgi:parallel beta-helix repeat protein
MAPEVESRRDSAAAEFWDMSSRTACDWDEERRQRQTHRDGYRPHFIDDPDFRIDVPALSFANADGTSLPADFDFLGLFFQQVQTGEWCDPAAKAYFAALAADTARAIELRSRLGDLTGTANLPTFERAFPRMTIVRLDVPAVTGYEYLRTPDLIYPHIRRFLESLEPDPGTGTDTVHVASPTGESETDRASILAALEKVRAGGTILFAAGTYLIGELIRVKTQRITLLGHPDGTTLRGCDPAEEAERRARFACHGLELTGGHQTVRNVTFERAHFDLVVGCCVAAPRTGETPPPAQPGGYVIEKNTFRESSTGIRVMGGSADPTVIRNNTFLNMGHAVGVNGGTVHIIDNDISALEPERIPFGNAVGAIGVNPSAARECGRHIIAGNRIEAHPDGITLRVWLPGTSCRQVVIRDNTIIVRRVRLADRRDGFRIADESDSTLVGVPLSVVNVAGDEPLPAPLADRALEGEAVLEANVIEGNRIIGGEGVGIEIRRSSGNRIVGNTITGIDRREPFPGNTGNSALPEAWRDANGSGIWISTGSDDNEIIGNTFEGVASAAVVIEGDSNQVELQSPDDAVRDLGRGNEVTQPGGDGERSPEEQTGDTVRVAPPTGDAQEDRAAILKALEAAGPNDVLLFGSGTYLTGGVRINVTTPGVTLVGDADGTVIRGCDRATLDTLDVAAMRQGRCAGLFALQGGRQAVRSMTLEGVHTALDLGWFVGEGDAPGEDGGYGVEDVTFRRVSKGVNVMGRWTEVATIRDNTFLNVYHAITLQGGTSHIIDNDISAPEPGTVFYQGFPGGAISAIAAPECGENVIAGNRIEGHPDGIIVGTLFPGTSCRNNTIRNNVVDVGRVTFGPDARGRSLINVEHENDRTVTGVPITILNAEGEESVPGGAPPEWRGPAFSGNHVIEGNRVLGAPGLGIQIRRSSGNRVANNAIEGVVRREPFPGNYLHEHPGSWEAANGSGIWISPGSEDNEIVGNTFRDVQGAEVFLEGGHNRVEARSTRADVRDLGSGNRVTVYDGGGDPTDSADFARATDAADSREPRYTHKFVEVGGVHLHYLDFGGEGLPILFTAGSRSAESWAGFAPRFADRHRVLAITDRGIPPSEGEASGYARRAGDILALLDTLGIERVVLVANSNPAQILIYLAEHHPQRLAGLVFLAPDSEVGLDSVEDPSGAMYMVERGLLSVQGGDPDEAGNWDEEDLYLPNYLASDTATIAVPALTFVNLDGTRGLERSYYPLEVAALVASGALAIPDSTARTYFERLAADEAMQAEVRAAWDGTFVPVFHANEQAFFRAFGDHLRVVRLDVPPMNGVPVVTGYEYRDAPELIAPHVRRFLDEVNSAELTRRDSVVSWLTDRALPIHGVTPGSGFEDLQLLKETLRDVRVMRLGEATHGTHEFFRFKHRLFEFMVREMGVRVLAFEASQSAAENVVDPYVQGGPGDVEAVVASLGLPGGWEEVRDVIAWMRDYNQGVSAGERVRFAGFDIQYNDEARRIVLEYLRRAATERVARTEALFQAPVDSLVYVPYLTRDTTAARVAAEVAAPALRSYRELNEFVRANEESLLGAEDPARIVWQECGSSLILPRALRDATGPRKGLRPPE